MTARSNMMRLFRAYCSQQIKIISWLFKFEDNKRSRIRAIASEDEDEAETSGFEAETRTRTEISGLKTGLEAYNTDCKWFDYTLSYFSTQGQHPRLSHHQDSAFHRHWGVHPGCHC